MNVDRLLSDLEDARSGEGFRGTPYKDTRGLTSIGYGRNLDVNPLTPDEGEYLLRNDVTRVQAQIGQRLPWVANLDDVRQRVLIELAFNMGIVGLLGFRKMLAAIQAEEWADARAELLASQWAHQVQPARRDRIASMLLTGEEM